MMILMVPFHSQHEQQQLWKRLLNAMVKEHLLRLRHHLQEPQMWRSHVLIEHVRIDDEVVQGLDHLQSISRVWKKGVKQG